MMTDRTNDNNSAELDIVLEHKNDNISPINIKNEKDSRKNNERSSRNNGEMSRTLT